MRAFSRRNRRATAAEALAATAFSPEDIFVLLGGPEMGCASAVGVDVDRDGWRIEGWHRNAIERLAPSGLVDASGVPCPELAAALEPLRPPGAFVIDESIVQKERPTRRASTAICVDARRVRATALIRRGRRFRLAPLATDPAARAASFERALGLDGHFQPSWWSQHAIRPWGSSEENEAHRALFKGDEEDVRLCAARHGVDPAALLDLKRVGARILIHLYAYSQVDPSCSYEWNLGFALPFPRAGFFRVKVSSVIPQKGFCLFQGCSPLPATRPTGSRIASWPERASTRATTFSATGAI
ncbi:hypothetical protein Corgl_0014 [Coriobacterium glomerans PW2]|uniref:Uncharacterized protein n=1 Tax=Coriobacterium glomerans (strain ATCC 49209 / DSM 20642 / JCM 10262 / PW2) TaxID=700015 RepID=F2N6U5_CORGP|nr:hypothetical protein [Coriobacterium glomerans]AEB06144.1 hypothetical protein Corgl_0014 [Coriobacterium glomerans PW2]